MIAVAYVLTRVAGKLIGNEIAARVAHASPLVRRYAGLCLLPQAGIAIGLGLVVAERFPSFGPELLSTLVGTTVVFEMLGPVVTRVALRRAGEAVEAQR